MSDSTRFDKILQKLQGVREQLEKAKVEVDLGMPAKKGKTATNEYVESKKNKWQEAKKAEFLAMTKSGQWTLEPLEKKHVGFKELQDKLEHEGHSKESAGNIAYSIGEKKYGKKGMEEKAHKAEDCMGKGEEQRKDNARDKDKKGGVMDLTPEHESPHNEPKGGPYAGSGKDRVGKSEAEPHKDDPHHEAKEKVIGKEIKRKAEKLLDMHKMDDATTMAGPVGSYDAVKSDDGAMSGDYHATGIEKSCTGKSDCQCASCMSKNDLPKDAEYQKHIKREPKDRA